jgi:uncharacterized membrane protein
MTQPWFDPNQYAWITGTVFGAIALVLGGLAAWFVPKGQARKFILSAWVTLWAVAIVLLCVGIAAWIMRQPWGVWYAILLPGFVGTAVLGGNLLVILKKYREVEQRSLAAK